MPPLCPTAHGPPRWGPGGLALAFVSGPRHPLPLPGADVPLGWGLSRGGGQAGGQAGQESGEAPPHPDWEDGTVLCVTVCHQLTRGRRRAQLCPQELARFQGG